MKASPIFAAGLALAFAWTTAVPASANAQFTVTAAGPSSLQAGLSGTYVVTASNSGDVAPVQVFIVFAGKLEQTGQIDAGGGFDCTVGHDTGSNAVVRCSARKLVPKNPAEIVVQGRGSAPGPGQLVVSINPDGSVPENAPLQGGNDNYFQKDVTIA